MCGLCGVISNYVSAGEYEDFLKLLLISQFRGRDSTGIFSVIEDKKESFDTKFLKQSVNSSLFLENNKESVDELHQGTSTKLVAGHCRHATKGAVTTANAHPFNFSNIIGMHNGTLSENLGKPRYIVKKGKKGNTSVLKEESDSESFFRYLNDNTLIDSLNLIQESGNAYAFVWFDRRNKTLNFVRNRLRPLWFAQTTTQTIYWASEKEMLEFVLKRNGSGMYSNNIDELMELPVHQHLSFDLTKSNPVYNYTLTPLKLKEPKTTTYSWKEGSFWGESQYAHRRHGAVVEPWRSTNWKKKEDTQEKKVVSLPMIPSQKSTVDEKKKDETSFFMINNHGYTRKEYDRLLEKGCIFCEQQAGVYDKVRWLNYTDYLCPICLAEPDLDSMAIPNFNTPPQANVG